jgi:hypothetical protein
MTAPEVVAALGNALALANEGMASFPCRADKRPATPHGFQDAVSVSGELRQLWRRYPGPLVGVPTGEASGCDVLDIDAPRHREAAEWWTLNRGRLPQTRTHRTRSGGLHLLFRHLAGLRCWTGRPVPGIDGRADGGYIVHWPAAGLPVERDAPPAPWPGWLLDELTPQRVAIPAGAWEPLVVPSDHRARSRYAESALSHATERVARAPVGSRNDALNGEAYGLGRLIVAGLLDGQAVADSLAAAAIATGLMPREIEATLRSAFAARGLL